MYNLDGRQSEMVTQNVCHTYENIYCHRLRVAFQRHPVTRITSKFALTTVY
jgi:hypothetical protein